MDEDESGAPRRSERAAAIVLLVSALIAMTTGPAGGIAYIVFTIRGAESWIDPISPVFWWEYVRTPLGATLTIVSSTALLVVFATLLRVGWRAHRERDRGRG